MKKKTARVRLRSDTSIVCVWSADLATVTFQMLDQLIKHLERYLVVFNKIKLLEPPPPPVPADRIFRRGETHYW